MASGGMCTLPTPGTPKAGKLSRQGCATSLVQSPRFGETRSRAAGAPQTTAGPMPDQIVITEKTSQAKDVRAAVGARYGDVLPAEGHLFDLQEPGDVAPEWKRWSPVLLRPAGLYPTRPADGGNTAAKLKAIREALRSARRVWLATDCDREGQLIGQEILEHYRYRGEVMRVMFTAQDPQSIRDAFARARPNEEYAALYAAAVARRQADQIYNLSLTRTATVVLSGGGTGRNGGGVIGVGRVKTPTLAIVCERELEIRKFVPVPYYEVVATAYVAGGSFPMRHAPKAPLLARALAERVAAEVQGARGLLRVRVVNRQQKPPRLHDLPSLQKLCAQRFGWTAERTLELAQALYDGPGKKIITYPRAEVRYLPESLIADVPRIVAGLRVGQAFAAIPVPEPPVIRRGAAGTFHDKGLEGASHHAVVPNVNTIGELRATWPRLSLDERRLFDIIARTYLAALMPDWRYLQTTVTLDAAGHPFRASGRQTIDEGWRAAFPARRGSERASDVAAANGETEADDAPPLPPLQDGEVAHLTDATIEDKETRAPPRYNEGTLIEAMQNAWRFVDDATLRERLKDARGIGTPATRATIIDGLKRQQFLVTAGRHIVPTDAGLRLHAVLKRADPALVDPGVTASMECQLDDVLSGRQGLSGAIDAVCEVATRIIGRLTQGDVRAGPPVLARSMPAASAETSRPTPAKSRSARSPESSPTARRSATAAAPPTARSGRSTRRKPRKLAGSATNPNAVAVQDERPVRRQGRSRKPRVAPVPAGGGAAEVTPLRIPYGNKEVAMQLGARYRDGQWYAPAGVNLDPFRRHGWL